MTNSGTVEKVDVEVFFYVGMLPRVGDFQQKDTARLAHQCASFSGFRNRRSMCDLICFLKIGYSGLSDQQGHVILTEGIGLCAKGKQSKWLEKDEESKDEDYRLHPKRCFILSCRCLINLVCFPLFFFFPQICSWLFFQVTSVSLVDKHKEHSEHFKQVVNQFDLKRLLIAMDYCMEEKSRDLSASGCHSYTFLFV